MVDLRHGDCLDVLRSLPDASVDAVVTDPPYGLSDHRPDEVSACLAAWLKGEQYRVSNGKRGFMGKPWDAWVPGPEVWKECLRVLKPGGHILAFAGTRSMDLMCMAIRLSGFELRDSIGWAHDGGGAPLVSWTYGSGFPKSLDVSKAIDKAAGAERTDGARKWSGGQRASGIMGDNLGTQTLTKYDTPATPEAQQWAGWGTALKPAWEPIILARKPLVGTVAENVLTHGTGGINVDGCRIESGGTHGSAGSAGRGAGYEAHNKPGRKYGDGLGGIVSPPHAAGRWPANAIHDGSDEVVGLFPQSTSGANPTRRGGMGYHGAEGQESCDAPRGAESGSAARFFYCAKASKRDRDEGLDGFAIRSAGEVTGGRKDGSAGLQSPRAGAGRTNGARNTHPTVKPTDLMRYLCRLVTPPGGLVLDPFMGSGSTGKAAVLEGFRFIGIEREAEYGEIARARIEAVTPATEEQTKAPALDDAQLRLWDAP